MTDPYRTTFASLRTNAQSLLGQAMALATISPWRSELVQRCHDLLKAIAFVESDDAARRIDDEEKKRGA